MQTNQRQHLRHRQMHSQRHRRQIPRKAGQNGAARPFSRNQTHSQQNKRGNGRVIFGRLNHAAIQPAPTHKGQQHKQRQSGGQKGDSERQGPEKCRRLDQKCMANPIKTGEKLTKTEQPAQTRQLPEVLSVLPSQTEHNGMGEVKYRQPTDRRKGQWQGQPDQQGSYFGIMVKQSHHRPDTMTQPIGERQGQSVHAPMGILMSSVLMRRGSLSRMTNSISRPFLAS